MIRNTVRRPMLSDSDAQRNRPAPFAIEIAPTSPAAAAARPVISSAMGAACEMMAMPAVVFRAPTDVVLPARQRLLQRVHLGGALHLLRRRRRPAARHESGRYRFS